MSCEFRKFLTVAMPLLGFVHLPASALSVPRDSVTVVYNHVAGKDGKELETGGGFAVHVRFDGHEILFDTGGERSTLMRNMESLDRGLSELDAVVISHNHWDHVYGLPGVGGSAPVYTPPSALEGIRQQNPRAELVAVTEPVEIAPGAWVLGPMEFEYRGIALTEQVLVLDRKTDLVVIVGCSHPGIVKIIETVKARFPEREIELVAGGMHLRTLSLTGLEEIAGELKNLGVQRIAPSHCTGKQAGKVFRRHWKKAFHRFDLGDIIRF